jgi:hypothetical protein
MGKEGSITFRCSAEFAEQLRRWAAERGLSVTDYIVLLMRGALEFHGLPPEMAGILHRERAGLGMNEFEYFHYAHFMRALELRRKGIGFDLPDVDRRSLGVRKKGRGGSDG